MAHHVFAWLSGFGWTVMPFAPYRFQQLPDEPRGVIVQNDGVWGRRTAKVTIAADGESFTRTRVGMTLFPKSVVDVFRGAARPHIEGDAQSEYWRVENEIFSIRWPAGFTLESTAEFPPPFDLVGEHHARIWVQGPVQQSALPPLEEMMTEDQTLQASSSCGGNPLVELAYAIDGVDWCMFHVVVKRDPVYCVVVSAQSHQAGRDSLRRAVEEVATSFIFHRDPEPVTG